MRTSSMNKLLALSALVCTLGLAPQKADAVVILNGCAGGTFANDCGLNELLAGADFSVDNKRFTNWDLVLFGGTAMLDAVLIRVDPIDSRFNPGFTLTDAGTTLRATSVATSIQNELSFNVIVTGGDLRSNNNSLLVAFGEMSNPSVDTYADVSETIFDSSFNLIGNKDVLCDAAACANGTGFDSADFAPQTSLLVFANISAVSAGVGDVAEIDTITLRFAQIPEPGTLTLLALGVTGMGWSLRRRRVRG